MRRNTAESQPRLDSAFPSLLVMGLCLLFAIACIVFCAWKIILLEQEREEITQQRLLLQRDRDAFLTYGGELPRLTAEHGQLERKVETLRENRTALEKDLAKLEEERAKLAVETGSQSGSLAALETQARIAGDELGKTLAELARLRPELEKARKDTAALKAEEKALAESIAKKRNDEVSIMASIAGLERSRQQAQEFLARLAADGEFYSGMEKNFEAALGKFYAVLARAANLTEAYAAHVDGMDKFKSVLDQGMAALASDLDGAAVNLEALKKHRASQESLLGQEAEQGKLLKEHVDELAATNKKLVAALAAAQDIDRKLRTALGAEMESLRRLAREDENTRATLAAAAATLAASARDAREDQARLRENMAELESLLNGRKAESRALGELAGELAALADRNREASQAGIQAGAGLSEAAQNLQKQVQSLKAAQDQAESQSRRIGELLAGELERQTQIAKLAREARDEMEAAATQRRELARLLEQMGTAMPPEKAENAEAATER